MQGTIQTNLGRNHYLQGNFDDAIIHLKRGLETVDRLGDRSTTVVALLHLAKANREINKIISAEAYCHEALNVARKNKLRRLEFEALLDLALICSVKDKNQARVYWGEAFIIAQEFQNEQLLENANNILSKI